MIDGEAMYLAPAQDAQAAGACQWRKDQRGARS